MHAKADDAEMDAWLLKNGWTAKGAEAAQRAFAEKEAEKEAEKVRGRHAEAQMQRAFAEMQADREAEDAEMQAWLAADEKKWWTTESAEDAEAWAADGEDWWMEEDAEAWWAADEEGAWSTEDASWASDSDWTATQPTETSGQRSKWTRNGNLRGRAGQQVKKHRIKRDHAESQGNGEAEKFHRANKYPRHQGPF